MGHLCYKCGHDIEDGKPFCQDCGAPQIRVAVPESEAAAVAGDVSSDVLSAPPVFSLDPPTVPVRLSAAALSGGIDWPRALRVCAIAALISIVVMTVRLMVPLLATLGAGCLAVVFYRRRNPTWRGGARPGAQLGAVTALFSSGILAIFSVIIYALLQAGGQTRQQLLEAVRQVASRSNDPQMQAALDLLKEPEGLAAKLIIGMAGLLLVSVAAGSLAGAMTGAFLRRRNRP
jgi:hypothetical protein